MSDRDVCPALDDLLRELTLVEVNSYNLDPPSDREKGTWWLCMTYRNVAMRDVEWNPERGYGLYRDDQCGYGEKPAHVTKDPKEAAQWIRDNLLEWRE